MTLRASRTASTCIVRLPPPTVSDVFAMTSALVAGALSFARGHQIATHQWKRWNLERHTDAEEHLHILTFKGTLILCLIQVKMLFLTVTLMKFWRCGWWSSGFHFDDFLTSLFSCFWCCVALLSSIIVIGLLMSFSFCPIFMRRSRFTSAIPTNAKPHNFKNYPSSEKRRKFYLLTLQKCFLYDNFPAYTLL